MDGFPSVPTLVRGHARPRLTLTGPTSTRDARPTDPPSCGPLPAVGRCSQTVPMAEFNPPLPPVGIALRGRGGPMKADALHTISLPKAQSLSLQVILV